MTKPIFQPPLQLGAPCYPFLAHGMLAGLRGVSGKDFAPTPSYDSEAGGVTCPMRQQTEAGKTEPSEDVSKGWEDVCS